MNPLVRALFRAILAKLTWCDDDGGVGGGGGGLLMRLFQNRFLSNKLLCLANGILNQKKKFAYNNCFLKAKKKFHRLLLKKKMSAFYFYFKRKFAIK